MSETQHDSAAAIAEITERLNALKRETSGTSAQRETAAHPVGRMMWLAFNVVSDLIAGVVCGLGIGYGTDRWLGTRPVFIAVFLIFGCAAGVLNAVRFLRRYDDRQREGHPDGKE